VSESFDKVNGGVVSRDGFGSVDVVGKGNMDYIIENMVPSYNDIVQQKPFPVFDRFSNVPYGFSVMELRGDGPMESIATLAVRKGVVFGGLGKYFSPIRTRSSRKKVQKESVESRCSGAFGYGPRDLRENKALSRSKR